MIREIKNRLRGRKKVKDECGATHVYLPEHPGLMGPSQTYRQSLRHFLEILRRGNEDIGFVTWRETIGWESRVKFSWDSPQTFSPKEAADYIERRNLLSSVWSYFESHWQVYSGRNQKQHYFDIDMYYCTFPMGCREVGELKHKITIDCLLTSKT